MKKILLFTDLSYNSFTVRGICKLIYKSNVIINDIRELLVDGYTYDGICYGYVTPKSFNMPGKFLHTDDVEKVVILGEEDFVRDMEKHKHCVFDGEVVYCSDIYRCFSVLGIDIHNTNYEDMFDNNAWKEAFKTVCNETLDNMVLHVFGESIDDPVDAFIIIMDYVFNKIYEGSYLNKTTKTIREVLVNAYMKASYMLDLGTFTDFKKFIMYGSVCDVVKNININTGCKDYTPYLDMLDEFVGNIWVDEQHIHVWLSGKGYEEIVNTFSNVLDAKVKIRKIFKNDKYFKVASIKHEHYVDGIIGFNILLEEVKSILKDGKRLICMSDDYE